MPRPVVQINDGWPVLDVARCIHPVTFWHQSAGSPVEYDTAGPLLTWRQVAAGMACIEVMRGTDAIRAGQTTAQLYAEVVCWYQAGIAADMQVRTEHGTTWVVQSVEDVLERNVVLRLNCVSLK